MTNLDRRMVVAGGLFSGGLALATGAKAFQAENPAETLFRNVRVFSGRSTRLSGLTDVLVRGNRIAAVGNGLASTGRTIEGRERTLIPGLIDVHAHLGSTTSLRSISAARTPTICRSAKPQPPGIS